MNHSAPDALRLPRGLAAARRSGVAFSLTLLLVAFVSVLWTPYPPDTSDVAAALVGSGPAHWLGTDSLGRDTLSLVMKGMLTSYVVTGVGLAIGVFAGVPLVLASAYLGVFAARMIEMLGATLLAIGLLGIAGIVAFHAGPSALAAMLAIGAFNAAVITGALSQPLASASRTDVVAAARLAGLSGFELLRRHVLPELAGPMAKLGAQLLAAGILLEAMLAYLGIGAQPGSVSLGAMLREARPVMAAQPLLLLAPLASLLAMSLALQLVALGQPRRGASDVA